MWVFQVTLVCQSQDENKVHRLETWLEQDSRIKEGVTLTLKEFPGLVWTVIETFGDTVIDDKCLYKPWKVGGLS